MSDISEQGHGQSRSCGKGGAETQLAEVHRIKGTCKCWICTVEHDDFSQIHRTDGFQTWWDQRHHWQSDESYALSGEKCSDFQLIPGFHRSLRPSMIILLVISHSGSIIHVALECRENGKADSIAVRGQLLWSACSASPAPYPTTWALHSCSSMKE